MVERVTRSSLVQQKDSFIQKLALNSKRCSFSTLHCRDFSFFLFSIFFLRTHKKHKNVNKRISYYFPLRSFLSTFFIFVRLQRFVHLLSSVFVLFVFSVVLVLLMFFVFFCVFLYVRKPFLKKKGFKTSLITSFILLLLLSFFAQKIQNSIQRTPGYSGHFFQEPQVSAIERFDCIFKSFVALVFKIFASIMATM